MSAPSTQQESILVKKENFVAWVTLNRPEVLNALDLPMLKKFQSVLKQLEADSEVRCLVIRGEGRGFCAGADLQSLRSRVSKSGLSLGDDLRDGLNPIVSRIRSMDKPVIAMVNGVAAGAGMAIAFACDLRTMSDSARFVEAFARVGLVPDSGATFLMPRLLGLTKAMELAFTGEGMDAKEAESRGIVNGVYPLERLETETRLLAEKIAKGPYGNGLSKRAIYRALNCDFDSALEYEANMQQIAGRSRDHLEGVKAFTEKRPPNFTGN